VEIALWHIFKNVEVNGITSFFLIGQDSKEGGAIIA